MARKTYPRPESHHRVAADNVLARHVAKTGKPVELPIPVEMIIESTYGLTILSEPIPEPDGVTILGALFPIEKRIVINETHDRLFETVVGPERFTLAHELGH